MAVMAFSVCRIKADETNPVIRLENEVPGFNFNFEHVPVSKVLDVYAQLAKVDLKNAQQIPWAEINLKSKKPLTRADAIQTFEKALREQAGVILKPLDVKHVEVTYDESVKVKM
jgi:hypothetical protein